MENRRLEINDEVAGKRLDIALALMNDDWSRSFVKAQIEANNVKVNGSVMYKANYKVSKGDIVEIVAEEVPQFEKLLGEDIPLDVIYEDEDLVVINKPAGMVVHPASGNWTGTVMNALIYHYKDLKHVGSRVRSGLIHRLDKETSGVLLIGKTNKGLWHYSKLFSQRKVKKTYIAVVSGKLPLAFAEGKKIEVKNYVARNRVNRKKMMVVSQIDVPKKKIHKKKHHKLRSSQMEKGRERQLEMNLPPDARVAHTLFEYKKSQDNRHLYFAEPKTGRTHQIRVHCAYLGTPVVGDKVYGGEENKRMMLHAYELRVTTPAGKLLKLEAEPDQEFVQNLRELGFSE